MDFAAAWITPHTCYLLHLLPFSCGTWRHFHISWQYVWKGRGKAFTCGTFQCFAALLCWSHLQVFSQTGQYIPIFLEILLLPSCWMQPWLLLDCYLLASSSYATPEQLQNLTNASSYMYFFSSFSSHSQKLSKTGSNALLTSQQTLEILGFE